MEAKLDKILNKINILESRIQQLEGKNTVKKVYKNTKNIKDINQVHIFPFTKDDKVVKMAIIEDTNKIVGYFPILEFTQEEFYKLANLVVNSQMSDIEWTAYKKCNSVAEYKNGSFLVC